jgi:TolB-like protein/DNA-binding winged helix-turn-helix (wHTH) protein/Flp pilus assembly protein TadD
MSALVAEDAFLFDGFRLDRRGGLLSRLDERGVFVPVPIGSRAFDVLGVLVARAGELVPRDEIIAAVWPATVVEDNNLNIQIAALRRTLDQARAQSYIQTIPGRGYRFVASVVRTNSAAPLLALPPSGNGVDDHITAGEQLQGCRSVPARPNEPPSQASRRRPWPGMIAGVIGILLFLLFVAAGVVRWHLRSSRSDETRTAPRLSIVVLPFANLSNDPDQQYFADGITEDLTTDLSRLADMLVISRNTAFTYRDKPVDAKQIGRDLGVRYLLEGSVQRSGNHVRANAQLVDAATDTHLWADRFDSDTVDLFALQNEITARIGNTLHLELIAAEAARPTTHPDALDYILRGRATTLKPNSPGVWADAISLFEHALALDPQSVEAQTQLANAFVARMIEGITASPAADLARAEELVGQALAANPRFAYAHQVKGRVLQAQNRWSEAVPEFETTLTLNRNSAWALHYLAGSKILTGSIEEAVPLEQQAIRLSPREPRIGWWYWVIGNVYLLQSRTDEAIVWYEKARSSIPAAPSLLIRLAAAYGLKGDTERAAAELAEARKLSPDDRFSSLARLQAVVYPGMAKIRALYETTYFAGLRKAGMPEE